MPSTPGGPATSAFAAPSMLDLVRLSPKPLFPPGGVDLYRQIALLTDMRPDMEVLDVACGKGVSLEYFVDEFGVIGSGVDVDPDMVAQAEARTRDAGGSNRLQFQSAPSDALPYRDEVFDVTVGEIGLANHCDPADAIRELARVTRPGGVVVLVQLVWKAPVDEDRRRVLASHLGARPLMLVEWRKLLRNSGVSDVHSEDWSDGETSFRSTVAKPFPDFAELFTLSEKLGILRRAWARWGWGGVRTVLAREREVHRLLTKERILGLDLLKGLRDPVVAIVPADVEGSAEGADPVSSTSVGEPSLPPGEAPDPPRAGEGSEAEQAESSGESGVADLPLFRDEAN